MSVQSPSAVLMIRPTAFHSNPETKLDNAFQRQSDVPLGELSERALAEFDAVADTLRQAGVTVHIFEDDGSRDTPDSVFPNNWISTHGGGHIAIYPMHAKSRQRERRWDVVEFLKRAYRVQDVIDYSGLEADGLALEGTGAMVLDHVERVAYTVRSNRADPVILERFCTNFGFEPMVFGAAGRDGTDVYHTNVMMALGDKIALIGLSTIRNPDRRTEVEERLIESGRAVIDLSHEQIESFAGNAMELTGRNGAILALSAAAHDALTPAQVAAITRHATLLPMPIPTIELAGGSIRCMLAGIHLTRRPGAKPAQQGKNQ